MNPGGPGTLSLPINDVVSGQQGVPLIGFGIETIPNRGRTAVVLRIIACPFGGQHGLWCAPHGHCDISGASSVSRLHA